MPNTSPKLMGKVKAPHFDLKTGSSPAKKSNLPVLLLIAAVGVGLIYVLRNKVNLAANTAGSSQVGSGPLVSIGGGSAPDQSTIDNLTASINALQGQVHTGSPYPGGGTSTPITPTPTSGSPANATGYVPPASYGNQSANVPGTPQYNAVNSPNTPYISAGLTPTIAFTPAQAQQWWTNWFANPVNLKTVDPNLLPGSLVLSPQQLKQAQQMQATGSTLPLAPRNYNPLNLPTIVPIPTGVA